MSVDCRKLIKRCMTILITFSAIAMLLVFALPSDADLDGPIIGNTVEATRPGFQDTISSGPGITTIDGDLVIDEDTHLENGTWVVNGNVEVGNATLTLDNVELTYQNLSPRASVSFEVEPWGDAWNLSHDYVISFAQ